MTTKEQRDEGQNEIENKLLCANFNPNDVGCTYGSCDGCKAKDIQPNKWVKC